ncbi:MAG: hypothetical protein NWQ28_03890, partial [Nodularia sp. (in: cyanobacteria)]|nr:hypothetical protein [Nodularia sp. (in: cyanobacteria)]
TGVSQRVFNLSCRLNLLTVLRQSRITDLLVLALATAKAQVVSLLISCYNRADPDNGKSEALL